MGALHQIAATGGLVVMFCSAEYQARRTIHLDADTRACSRQVVSKSSRRMKDSSD
jgi:hypothetical protein